MYGERLTIGIPSHIELIWLSASASDNTLPNEYEW
jgi:hypothetical protein